MSLTELQKTAYDNVIDSMLPEDDDFMSPEDTLSELKSTFLQTLDKAHFVNLTCKHTGIKEKLVRSWMRSDPEFAAAVKATQLRTAEKVGLALISKALGENDLAAQMFLAKQFGNSMQMVEDVEDSQPVSGIDVSVLTAEEQTQLLTLLRKVDGTKILTNSGQ